MSAEDQDLFGKLIKIENKDIFIDLRKNENGIYLKLSERRGAMRKTVLIPASGISRLQAVLEEVKDIVNRENAENEVVSKIKGDEPSTASSPSIYVAGLDWECTEDELRAHFESIAPIVKAVILRKARKGKLMSMGCGVVEFSSISDAERAIASMNDTLFQNRIISCRADLKVNKYSSIGEKMKRVAPNKIFVTNVGIDTIAEDVTEHFSSVGVVKQAHKITDRVRSHSAWILEYDDEASVQLAIQQLNNSELDGNQLMVREFVLHEG